jgi:hypothetical protein
MASCIAAQLHTMLPKPCRDRPFVCDGLPENCSVIVIGKNPALKLGVDWWTFWDDDSGFDLQKFKSLFEEKRNASRKRLRLKTRKALDHLLDPLRAEGLGCLETNVFRDEKGRGYKPINRNDDVLQTLLAELQQLPNFKAVIAHGKHAKEFMSGQSLPPHIKCFQTDHFVKFGYPKIDSIMRKILKHK